MQRGLLQTWITTQGTAIVMFWWHLQYQPLSLNIQDKGATPQKRGIQYIPYIIPLVCYALFRCGYIIRSYDCPSASEATLKDMGEQILWMH